MFKKFPFSMAFHGKKRLASVWNERQGPLILYMVTWFVTGLATRWVLHTVLTVTHASFSGFTGDNIWETDTKSTVLGLHRWDLASKWPKNKSRSRVDLLFLLGGVGRMIFRQLPWWERDSHVSVLSIPSERDPLEHHRYDHGLWKERGKSNSRFRI